MQNFSMHAYDDATSPMIGKLMQERDAHSSFALTNPGELAQLDPETVASRYLEQALQSKDVGPFGQVQRGLTEISCPPVLLRHTCGRCAKSLGGGT
jgi:hypothetical protein